MDFRSHSAGPDPRGLILDMDEARRARAVEAERIRAAQEMVERFFAGSGRASTR
jgi:hypothetical protein